LRGLEFLSSVLLATTRTPEHPRFSFFPVVPKTTTKEGVKQTLRAAQQNSKKNTCLSTPSFQNGILVDHAEKAISQLESFN